MILCGYICSAWQKNYLSPSTGQWYFNGMIPLNPALFKCIKIKELLIILKITYNIFSLLCLVLCFNNFS